MSQLLLIDDDAGLSELLKELLELEGFQLSLASDGEQGLAKALSGDYQLILLDVMLPKINGFELLKQLRQHQQTPVIMLTARGDEIDRVVGLEIGADDYLPKPFNDRELIARIRAILRRSKRQIDQQGTEQDMMLSGDIKLNIHRQEAFCNDQLLELTDTQFSLLIELVAHRGKLLTKELLSQKVLGKRLMPYDRSLDMHLSNLRKKLPDRKDGRLRIKTLRGKGYIWLP